MPGREGTLAPWNPTQRLVVQGVYCHVRNPMISGVLAILLGEAVMAASLPLLSWFLVFVIGNALYIPLAEEPGLVKRFGQEYEVCRWDVPRWIPRLNAVDRRGYVTASKPNESASRAPSPPVQCRPERSTPSRRSDMAKRAQRAGRMKHLQESVLILAE